jgi:hypothetical protein
LWLVNAVKTSLIAVGLLTLIGMDTELEARVKREREAHNAGISRTRYERAFGHSEHFHLRKHRDIISATFKEHEAGHFLEIGSISWQWWIEPFGIEPRSLTCINISEAELQKGIDIAARSKTNPAFAARLEHLDPHQGH